MKVTKYEMKSKIVAIVIFIAVLFGVVFFITARSTGLVSYTQPNNLEEVEEIEEEEIFIATHIETPEQVKGIYMTSWVAGTPSFRSKLVKLIEETEINSVVIDIKDYTGKVSFLVDDPVINAIGSAENRISDIREFIKELHNKNIYVIGRIQVFQDPFLVSKRPDLAVQSLATGGVWSDYKGIEWLDPASKEVWDYTVALSRASYNEGFDEINFDYIRFPSDGNMKDVSYVVYNAASTTKRDSIRNFFRYLDNGLSDIDVKLSADLFGMTTTNKDDLNIGQYLEFAVPYFDYIMPMVYPSHYPPTFNGYANPASEPYGVVKFSMDRAVERLIAASTSPKKLRPWLQDFDLGATYTPEMVRAQINATYDAGLDSWILWDAANTYTRSALFEE